MLSVLGFTSNNQVNSAPLCRGLRTLRPPVARPMSAEEEANIDPDVKAEEVQRVCRQLGCETSAAVVAGDGANDLKMMALAGWSVAFRAKPVVQAKATMAINFNGLDALVNVFE